MYVERGENAGCSRNREVGTGKQPQHRHITCAVSATAEPVEAYASWEGAVEDDDVMGPAFKATLAMLEWPRLCEHIAAFASTTIGRAAVQVLANHRPLQGAPRA